jgi:hypothetical protein
MNKNDVMHVYLVAKIADRFRMSFNSYSHVWSYTLRVSYFPQYIDRHIIACID